MIPSSVRCKRLEIAVAVVLSLAPVTVLAKDKGATEHKPIIDPRADRVLRNMSDYLSQAEQFTVRAEIQFDDVLPSGQKIQYTAVEDVAVRRPNRVYTEYDGDLGSKRLWYDGKSITMYDNDANVYATTQVPGKIDAALDDLMKKHGFSPPLSDLLHSDPYAILKPHADYGLYLGEHVVDGVRCHHLAFVDPSIDWQIWVEDGTEIVPRKVVITYKTLPESPQFEAVLSDWDFNARLIDAQFTPMIPPDAVKIPFVPIGLSPEKGAAKK